MADEQGTASVLVILLLLAGCLTICFAVISAAILIPALFGGFDAAVLGAFTGYLLLAGFGLGLMLLGKRLLHG